MRATRLAQVSGSRVTAIDARYGQPRPGAGHLDWPAWLGALDAAGYTGELAVECRLSGEPAEALRGFPPFLHRAAGLRRADGDDATEKDERPAPDVPGPAESARAAR